MVVEPSSLSFLLALAAAATAPAAPPAPSATDAWTGTVTIVTDSRVDDGGDEANHASTVDQGTVTLTLFPGAGSALVEAHARTEFDGVTTTVEAENCDGTQATLVRAVRERMVQAIAGLGLGTVRIEPGAGATYRIRVSVPSLRGGTSSIETLSSVTGGCTAAGAESAAPARSLSLLAWDQPHFDRTLPGVFEPPDARHRAAGTLDLGETTFAWTLARGPASCSEVRKSAQSVAERLRAARAEAVAVQGEFAEHTNAAASAIASAQGSVRVEGGRRDQARAAMLAAARALPPTTGTVEAYAAALARALAGDAVQQALGFVSDAIGPEPLPELESWLRTLLDLRRASANLDTLVALHGELAAVCPPGSP